jgi:predicted MPP superfamily phosphohydrolase
VRRSLAALSGLAATGVSALAYGTLIERNLFTLRRFDVPILAPGERPLRLLHVSDLHITADQKRKQRWISALADLEPDLVINTGDTISAADAIPQILTALKPLARFPAAFVPGNNDYYAPRLSVPTRYFTPAKKRRKGPRLPWERLAQAMADQGWTDLTHVRTVLATGNREVALAGTDDPHLRRARYERIAGPAPTTAVARIGVIHSPEPYLLRRFSADGYDLTVAGHTHGGQVRIPFGPAIVTNCGIDPARARWLHRWDDSMWFHVCAGLGTNPFMPIRFACRPEASLLTLVPRAG